MYAINKYYFAYGGNTNPIHMTRSYPNAKVIGNAHISGFKILFQSTHWCKMEDTLEDAYCNMIECENSSVHGVLYELTEEDMFRLDKQERVPFLYIKINLPEINAFTYVMNTKEQTEKQPTNRYYNVVLYGYTHYNLPLSQIKISSSVVNIV